MQKEEFKVITEWIEASLLIQTSIEGGFIDKDITDVAVIACLTSSSIADITLTVEVTPLIEVKKLFFNSRLSIWRKNHRLNIVTSDFKRHNIVHMAKRQASTNIIAGNFKGTKLNFKPNKALRPTESKTKETLFNWLLNDLEQKVCLDMYAGTGALGLEAISRGANKVVFIEKQKRLCENLGEVIRKLKIEDKCRIINTNAASFAFDTLKEKFDLIFLDPPFNENLSQRSFDIISRYDLLASNGLVYLECERDLDIQNLNTSLTKIKESKGGETKYCLYES